MKAPINYFGGKNIMFKYIIEKFPNRETYDTYIEPFGGSYAVGLNMSYIPPVEIYNDLEKNIYSLYKVLRLLANSVLSVTSANTLTKSDILLLPNTILSIV